MATQKKAQAVDKSKAFSERVDAHADKLKQRESDMLAAAREALETGSEHAESALHRATDATASAAKHANRRAADLGELGQEQWDKGRERVGDSVDQVIDYVRRNPGKSMIMAVAGGWLLGNILRRRH